MQSQKVTEFIVNWLSAYAKHAGVEGFVVGVSGGIDSAVTSTLCAKTGLEVLCLEMPIHQHPDQVSRAQRHIQWLVSRFPQVAWHSVNLTPVYDQFCQTIYHTSQPQKGHEMALVNARARLRMTTLYYYAANHGFLVAGTGNKVEDFGVGFYTKYGDGGVDISPIADLLKTEVYEMAKHLGIIEEIQLAPPTDGLWGDSRTDEEQIGASYPELEWAMQFAGSESSLSHRQKEVLTIYRKFNSANRHKMDPIPVCQIPANLKNDR